MIQILHLNTAVLQMCCLVSVSHAADLHVSKRKGKSFLFLYLAVSDCQIINTHAFGPLEL